MQNEAGAMPDERPTVLAGMVLTTIGMQVFIIQPGFLTGLQAARHLTDAAVGYVASAEMVGIALATIIAPLAVRALEWRSLCVLAILVLAIANLATIPLAGGALLAVRFMAGCGAGALISVGYAMVGLSARPERAFGYLITVVLGYGALGIFALPSIIATFGFGAVLVGLAVMALAGASVLRRDVAVAFGPDAQAGRGVLSRRGAAVLGAVLAYFLGQGVVWPYLSLIGSHFGLADQTVANALTVAQLAGVLGALLTALCGNGVRTFPLVFAGALGSIVPLLVLSRPVSAIGFTVAVSSFNLAANMMTSLLIAIVARVDENGVLVQRAAALQMCGLAIGPALAAYLIGASGMTPALLLASAFFALSLASSALGSR